MFYVIAVMIAWALAAYYLVLGESTLIILTVLAISTFYLLRITLMTIGVFKDPILRRFEKYGDIEEFFYPYPELLFWLGIFAIAFSLWLSLLIGVHIPGELIGVILLGTSYLAHRMRDYVRLHPHEMYIYPHWLFELQERSSRLERRRIAYMWLRLPWKTRLAMNSNDRAFLEWADMIILATLM